MDYTAFQALVASYAHRTDLTAVIPTFIEHGRIRMCDDLRVAEMVVSETLTLTGGIGTLNAETVAIRSVQGPTQPLLVADLDIVTTATVESVYAIVGLEVWAPGCGTVDVITYRRPLTLVGDGGTGTRAVLTSYPNVWLFAALTELAVYVQDYQLEQAMQARMDAEIQRANARANRIKFPRAITSDSYVNVTAGGPGL